MRSSRVRILAAVPVMCLALLSLQPSAIQGEPRDRWAPPALGDDEIARALDDAAALRAGRIAMAVDPRSIPAVEQTLAEEIERGYRIGAAESVERILELHPDLCAYFDDPRAGIVATGTVQYRGSEGTLVVHLQRTDAGRSQVVVLPPGTYGVQAGNRFESDRAQDLALLRPHVARFRAGQTEAVATLPMACALFTAASPQPGDRYVLRRFDRRSTEAALMDYLCTGEAKPECESQLAIWFVHNGMSAADLPGFVARHPVATFQTGLGIQPSHLRGTADVLLKAGIDPRSVPFFADDQRPNDRS